MPRGSGLGTQVNLEFSPCCREVTFAFIFFYFILLGSVCQSICFHADEFDQHFFISNSSLSEVLFSIVLGSLTMYRKAMGAMRMKQESLSLKSYMDR